MSKEKRHDIVYFKGSDWLATLSEDVQTEWQKAYDENPDPIHKEKLLSETFSHLNWFIWASFTMKTTSQGLEYWERVIRDNQLTSYQTLHRNQKLNTIGI